MHPTGLMIRRLMDRYVLPTYSRLPVCLVRGRGAWVWDTESKRYLDFFSGLAVNNLGHAPSVISRAIARQARQLIHCSNVFYIREQAELAQRLIKATGLHQAFFCNSGAEAIEAAIKFARHTLLKKRGGGLQIIVAKGSFHGRTLGALSATMQRKYQEGFGRLVPGFKAVPFNDMDAMKRAVGGETGAILLEPIQGEGGVKVPDDDYLRRVKKLCSQMGLLLILDEVQVGMGRTGSLFACQHYGVAPDILVIAKALGSGYPIGACLVSAPVARTITPGIHASTFGGNPVACLAALETLKIISKTSFLNHVRMCSSVLLSGLYDLSKRFSIIKEVRGVGLMTACELGENIGNLIVRRCLEEGLIINSIQDKIIRLIPPLNIKEGELKKGLQILEGVFSHL